MPKENWTHHHDLLYMYICLGHLPDKKLDLSEISEIAQKFKKWLPAVNTEEFKAIRAAVFKKYHNLDGFQKRFDQYVKSAFMLRDYFTGQESKLLEVMDDLIGIASADRSVSPEEITLIKAAVKTWWLDLDPCTDGDIDLLKRDFKANGSKTIPVNGSKNWGFHHDILYMLVSMGHLPDREFSYDEVDAIMEIWQRRFPEMKSKEFQKIRAAVIRLYNEYEHHHDRYNQFLICAQRLKEHYHGKPERTSVLLNDLFTVARSDNAIHQNEVTMIEAVAKIWDLDIDIKPDRELAKASISVCPSKTKKNK